MLMFNYLYAGVYVAVQAAGFKECKKVAVYSLEIKVNTYFETGLVALQCFAYAIEV